MVTRRRFMASFVGSTLALALSACAGPSQPPPTASPPPKPTSPPPAAAQPTAAPTTAPSKPPAATAAPAPTAVPKTAAAPSSVVLTLPVDSMSLFPFILGRDKGYYEEEGLKVDPQVVAPNQAVQMVVGGHAAFTSAGSAALAAGLQGAPMRIVINYLSTVPFWLMASPQSGVRTVADLKGKAIGIEGPSTISSTFVRALLRKYGLDPDRDVTYAGLGPAVNWLPAVSSGAVDAALAPDVDPYLIAKGQGLVEVASLAKDLGVPLSGIGTTEAILREQPDMVKRFVRGSIKGIKHFKAKKDDVIALAASRLSQRPELASQTYDILHPMTLEAPMVDDNALRTLIDLMRQTLNIDRPVSPADLFKYEFVRQAVQELDREAWKPR